MFAFGTVINVSPNERTRVLLIPTSSTIPSFPPHFIQSPNLKGLSTIIINPAIKFSIVSFAASATAKPPIPSPARSAEIL